jgi:phytoene dehydrogenase-like protein
VQANARRDNPTRASPVKRAYDVCVLGSQLAGVAAGALLARRGYRVLHVDPDGRGVGFDEGGYRLPWGPSLVPALRQLPAAEALLGELGLANDLGRLETGRPALQLLLPRHRLDLPAARAERGAELRREWPADAARLETALVAARTSFDGEQPFLAAFPPIPARGLGDRWRFHRTRGLTGRGTLPLADLGDHPLAGALRAAWPFLTSLDGAPTPLGFSRTLGAALHGTLRLAGGESALAALFRRRISESRGELLGGEGDPTQVSALEMEGRTVSFLRVKGGESRFAARAFLFAGDPGTLPPLLGDRAGRIGDWIAPAAPAGALVTRSWVLHADALPPPLGDVALALGPEGEAVLLQALPAVRGAAKGHETSPGERVLTAAIASPGGPEGDAAAMERLRRVVDLHLPFLDRATVLESEPGRRPAGRAFHPLLASTPERVLGIGAVPTRSPIGNLFLAGREVVPGLGTEGQFHAAWQAAHAIERHLGTKNRPK